MRLDFITKVIEFMNKFEQSVETEITVPTTKQKILRFSLLEEEKNELIEAYFYRDEDYNKFLVETADAICDSIYILAGTVADYGCKIYDYKMEEAHNIIFNNITPPEDTQEYINVLVFKVLPVFMNNLYSAMIDNDHHNISLSLCFVEYILLKIADLYGFPIDELFNEVHRSNMSKLHNGVVVKNEFGKVVKSPDYSPADIKGILVKNGLLK